MPTRITISDKLSAEQAFMLAQMIQRQRERSVGWAVELVDEWPSLLNLKTRVVTGFFSWSLSELKIRLLKRSHATDIGGGWVTPGDVARDYLAIKYANRRARMTTSQWRACVEHKISTPLHSTPGAYPDAVYIDLQGAYWNIVRSVGWDVNYNPLRFLSPQSDVDDFPVPAHKMARNCLVSCGLPGSLRVWNGERLTVQKKPNRFINLMLYRLVCDVLNGVAYDLVRSGAVYVYTDGYIISRRHVDTAFAVIQEWGLSASIKHEGDCIVHGPASYKFPDYQTKGFGRRRPIEMSKIEGGDNEWLRWRFKAFADRANSRDKLNA